MSNSVIATCKFSFCCSRLRRDVAVNIVEDLFLPDDDTADDACRVRFVVLDCRGPVLRADFCTFGP